MSYFECPCGQEFDIFGRGGAQKTAENFGVDFLGAIPIVKEVRELSDSGKPIVVSQPNSKVAKMYGDIARKVMERLQSAKAETQGPNIVME
jgi:ATP-binding protein involved in chromosome partitioning